MTRPPMNPLISKSEALTRWFEMVEYHEISATGITVTVY
jgi:hypothetical protein